MFVFLIFAIQVFQQLIKTQATEERYEKVPQYSFKLNLDIELDKR